MTHPSIYARTVPNKIAYQMAGTGKAITYRELDELSNQYLLGYASTNNKRDDGWRRIRVDVDGHHEVRARQGYRVTATK